jgi:exonuclease VII small subunit
MTKKNNLSENLKKLKEISSWFDNQEEVDVEEGLNKVKEAVEIIKESKGRLREIENEFEKVKKDLEKE